MHGVPVISQPCNVCGRPTSMWCSRCQRSWYCSPEHIHSDWPHHRQHCHPYSEASTHSLNMIATPPPAEPQLITVSAIFFSPEDERPRIVTLNCKPSPKASQGMCPTPILDPFFNRLEIKSIVLTQGLNGEPLRFPLQLWYSPQHLNSGTPVNRAIFHITSGAAEKPWAGPVVVLKYNGARRQGYSDAGSNDLPALSAYFLAYK